MNLDTLKKIFEDAGIVGAGGGGFPSFKKLDSRAHTIILNCAECEPLLTKDQHLLSTYTLEILTALAQVAGVLDAKVIVAIKESYIDTIAAVEKQIKNFSNTTLVLLGDFYPTGDEIVLVYEATGVVVPPGALPIDVGCIVYNVETVYNMHNALTHGQAVTHKWLTIAGVVKSPQTVCVEIGTKISEILPLAGGVTIQDPAFIAGGAMMGSIVSGSDEIKKTTNAVLVVESGHLLTRSHGSNMLNRVASACCQCRTCTDMCPRNQLGYPIEPHRIMRAAANRQASDTAFKCAMYCSLCGVCEMVACPQSLAPRTLIKTFRQALSKEGARPEKCEIGCISAERNGRLVNSKRLKIRLGLK